MASSSAEGKCKRNAEFVELMSNALSVKFVKASEGEKVVIQFLKVINNSSSLNKEYHDQDAVWISDLN